MLISENSYIELIAHCPLPYSLQIATQNGHWGGQTNGNTDRRTDVKRINRRLATICRVDTQRLTKKISFQKDQQTDENCKKIVKHIET